MLSWEEILMAVCNLIQFSSYQELDMTKSRNELENRLANGIAKFC